MYPQEKYLTTYVSLNNKCCKIVAVVLPMIF